MQLEREIERGRYKELLIYGLGMIVVLAAVDVSLRTLLRHLPAQRHASANVIIRDYGSSVRRESFLYGRFLIFPRKTL
ncbi:hypothetical protein DQX05_28165 [Paenibacillus thiaminolyticus]|uniref:Uncharacterized protein n=1 Tax=Paenibacillus thiaminolyticus TaxID=49283 RepID=A0A3A3G9C4_PANTH|nr:hypothetical protein DQX05_28165 [Paenibacillus thiaminolyticus]